MAKEPFSLIPRNILIRLAEPFISVRCLSFSTRYIFLLSFIATDIDVEFCFVGLFFSDWLSCDFFSFIYSNKFILW